MQQPVAWTSVDPDLWRRMASLSHSEFYHPNALADKQYPILDRSWKCRTYQVEQQLGDLF